MLKYKNTTIIFIISILTSCMCIKNNKLKSNIPNDKQWNQTLYKNKETYLNIFKTEALNDQSSWNKIRSELNISDAEKENLECIPIEIYTIDIKSLKSINSDVGMLSAMVLKKNESSCFLLNNHDFLISGSFELKNNTWHAFGYGLIDKTFSTSLADLHFNKNAKIIMVHLKVDSGYQFEYYTYQKNNILWSVNHEISNQKIKLFDLLQNFKEAYEIK
jgi:hypothetical protein